MNDGQGEITPLIESGAAEVIGGRFLVKGSTYNDGIHAPSIMLVIADLIDKNFKIQFFKDRESAAGLLKLLNAAT